MKLSKDGMGGTETYPMQVRGHCPSQQLFKLYPDAQQLLKPIRDQRFPRAGTHNPGGGRAGGWGSPWFFENRQRID